MSIPIVSIDPSKAKAHDIYNKHYIKGGVHHCGNWHIAQCSCGRWFWYMGGLESWQPLVGPLGAYIINDLPQLYEPLRDYYLHMNGRPKEEQEAMPCSNWGEISKEVNMDIRAANGDIPVSNKGDISLQTPATYNPNLGQALSYPNAVIPPQSIRIDDSDNRWVYNKSVYQEKENGPWYKQATNLLLLVIWGPLWGVPWH